MDSGQLQGHSMLKDCDDKPRPVCEAQLLPDIWPAFESPSKTARNLHLLVVEQQGAMIDRNACSHLTAPPSTPSQTKLGRPGGGWCAASAYIWRLRLCGAGATRDLVILFDRVVHSHVHGGHVAALTRSVHGLCSMRQRTSAFHLPVAAPT